MNDTRVYANQETVHCVELSSGTQKTGLFYIKGKQILLKAVSYDVYFNLSKFNPLFIKTENGDIISLYGNHGGHTRTRHVNLDCKENTRTIHSCDVSSNIAIVGREKWVENQSIKRVCFSAPDANDIFIFTPELMKIKSQDLSRYTRDPTISIKDQIFTLKSQDCTIRCMCALTWNFLEKFPSKVKPIFEIEFLSRANLDDAFEVVEYVVSFFSFILSKPIKATDFSISSYSKSWWSRMNSIGKHIPDHELYYPHFLAEETSDRNSFRQSFFLGKAAVSDLKICLVAWMNRRIEWRKSSKLMLHSLARCNEHSGERLLCACRWLEELPNYKAQRAVSKSDSLKIADAAALEAKALGYTETIQNRVRGSVAQLTEESHRQRFTRLVNAIENKFGSGIIGKHFVDDLLNGIRCRGLAAHGLFRFEDDQDNLNAIRGTHAIEILCTLLMAMELPLPNEFSEQFSLDERIQEYRGLYVTIPTRG